MLCPRCKKNESNVIITQVTNGQKQEYRVCNVCASQMGLLSGGIMVNMSDFISGFVGKGVNVGQDIKCPSCGTSLREFTKTSKLGCGECYNTFSPQIDKIMKKMHGSTSHTGKFPLSQEGTAIKKRKLQKLREEIAAAIASENFERAAELRDEIKLLSAEVEGQV